MLIVPSKVSQYVGIDKSDRLSMIQAIAHKCFMRPNQRILRPDTLVMLEALKYLAIK